MSNKNIYKGCPCGNDCPVHFRMLSYDPMKAEASNNEQSKENKGIAVGKRRPIPIPECRLRS